MTKAEQTVRVTEETWEVMHRQKRPGDTFNDIIRKWGMEAGYIEPDDEVETELADDSGDEADADRNGDRQTPGPE